MHITIPMTKVPDDFQSYGVIISLGWHDPSHTLARRVFKVTVTFRDLRVFRPREATGERWLFTFGVNGRWFHRRIDVPSDGTEVVTNASVTLFLSLDDTVFVAAHGFDQDGVGREYELIEPAKDPEEPPPNSRPAAFDDFMEALLRSRKLRLAKTTDVPTGVDKFENVETMRVALPFVGRPVVWEDDVDTKDNDVLGFVDQNVFDPKQPFGRRNDGGVDTPNPLSVSVLLNEVKVGGTKTCKATGYAMTQIGRMGVLALDDAPGEVQRDYELTYDVKIEAQAPPPPLVSK